jgi:Gamma-aminobutyrate permease and related permeases
MAKNRPVGKTKEKGLSAAQLVMMALGTVIGGSYFLGSAVAINAAGPSILIGFILGGVMVYFILFALSEMTVANPEVGSFRAFAARAFGPGAGFVVGWVYWTGMVLAMSSEATAVTILLREWLPGLSLPLMGGLVIAGVTLLNLLGADKLGKLESGLAAVKVFAIAAFIIMAVLLVAGLFAGRAAVGMGALKSEPFWPGGIAGLSGSLLIVMFTYAGFEVIGLAASEARQPKNVVIPRAIRRTVFCLIGFYVVSVAALLPLVSTGSLSENASPFVAALSGEGIGWAGTAMNLVLISAILSTMLAAMFGLGRMMRSLAGEGMAPRWLRDKTDVPRRGILASGAAMLVSLGVGQLLPSVYVFLISSGGFAMLLTYAVIMATHIRFRRRHGCPPDGKCQLWGFPYTSALVLALLAVAIGSMPFIKGQLPGLIAGCILVAVYALAYAALRAVRRSRLRAQGIAGLRQSMAAEASKELGGRPLRKGRQ